MIVPPLAVNWYIAVKSQTNIATVHFYTCFQYYQILVTPSKKKKK